MPYLHRNEQTKVCILWAVLFIFSLSCTFIFSNTDAPKCPEEVLDGVSWAVTAGGGTDVEPCPNGASGKWKKTVPAKSPAMDYHPSTEKGAQSEEILLIFFISSETGLYLMGSSDTLCFYGNTKYKMANVKVIGERTVWANDRF